MTATTKKQLQGEINVGTEEAPEMLTVRLLSGGDKLDADVEGRSFLKGIDAVANTDMVWVGTMIARLRRAIVEPTDWLTKVLDSYADDHIDRIRQCWEAYSTWCEEQLATLKNA